MDSSSALNPLVEEPDLHLLERYEVVASDVGLSHSQSLQLTREHMPVARILILASPADGARRSCSMSWSLPSARGWAARWRLGEEAVR